MNLILAIVVIGVVLWLLDDDDGPGTPLKQGEQVWAYKSAVA